MSLKALREKRAQIVADMEGVLATAESEARELDDTESELYAEYEQDLARVKANIERRETLASEQDSLAAVRPADVRGQIAEPERRQPAGPEAKREFGSMGEFMGAVINHARGRGTDARLEWQDNIQAADGQRMDEGSAGGFLVPTQHRQEILRVEPQEAIIRGRSNIIPAGSPPDAEITMPALDQTGENPGNRYGGVEVNWIGEGDVKPETEAKFREISLLPQELAANIPLTDKLMRNAPAMSSMVEMLMRQALIAAQERAFLQGNGVGKPLGILNAPATIKVNRDSANTVVYEDIDAMVAKSMTGDRYWLASQSVYTQLTRLQDPQGKYVWQANAVEGSPGSLFGIPVFWHERSPILGSYGDLTLVNSNPYYLIKEGSGPFVAAGHINDDFVRNQTRIKVFTNVDAKPWLNEPMKQEGGFEVSPFVALDVPNG